MNETAGQYLDRLEDDHDLLHLANKKIAELEAENTELRETALKNKRRVTDGVQVVGIEVYEKLKAENAELKRRLANWMSE